MTGRSGSKGTCGFLLPDPPGQRLWLNIKIQDHSKPTKNKREKRNQDHSKAHELPKSSNDTGVAWPGGKGPKIPTKKKKSQKQRRTALEAGIWVGPGRHSRRTHHRVSGPLHSDILTTLSISGPHTVFRESVSYSVPPRLESSSYKSWIYGLRLGRVTFGAKKTQDRTQRQNADAVLGVEHKGWAGREGVFRGRH